MRRIVSLFVLLPIAAVIVTLSVANRGTAIFSFDPVEAANSPLALQAPMFVVLFAAVAVGIVIGGVATWLRQGRWRSAAKLERANAERLRRETVQLRQQLESQRLTMPLPLNRRDAA